MEIKMTNAEKVIFNATKNFCMNHGYDEITATEKAYNKILKVRDLKKQVTKF